MAFTNPLSAPEPREFVASNIVRCTKNEVGDMPLALKAASNIAADEYVEFWSMEYECLDTQFADGNPARRFFGSRTTDKNGDQLDSTQRPYVNAAAFAGLGIVVYPEDPNYDESLVVGNVFVVEQTKFATGKPSAIPTEVLGPDYVFEGDVYTIPAKSEGGAATAVTVTGGSVATVEIVGNAELEAQLTGILETVGDLTDKTTVRAALMAADFGNGLTLNGFGVAGLAITGKLVDQAREAGLIS